jgi:hypothetical protein
MAPRRFEHFSQILFCLKKGVFGCRLADREDSGDLPVAKAFDLVQQEDVSLVPSQLGKRSFERHPQRRMGSRRARLGLPRSLLRFVV